jgi:hypothetical protein
MADVGQLFIRSLKPPSWFGVIAGPLHLPLLPHSIFDIEQREIPHHSRVPYIFAHGLCLLSSHLC